MASISTFRSAPRAQPASRFSSTFAPAGRSASSRSIVPRTKLPSEGIGARTAVAGRRNQLEREGIVPAAKNPNRLARERDSTNGPGGGGSPGTLDHSPPPRRRAPTASTSGNSAGVGWSRQAGRGELAYDGSGFTLDCLQPTVSTFMFSRPPDCDNVTSGRFTLSTEVTCLRTCGASASEKASDKDGAVFAIALGVQSCSPSKMVAISMNTTARAWRLMRLNMGRESVVSEIPDRGIRVNARQELYIEVNGNYISMTANGRPVFTNTLMSQCSLSSPVGLQAKASQIAVHSFHVDALTESAMPPPPAPAKGRSFAGTSAASVADSYANSLSPPDEGPSSGCAVSSPGADATPTPKFQKSPSAPAPAQAARPVTTTSNAGGGKAAAVPAAPKSAYSGDEEPRLVEMIERDIIDTKINLTWDDIASLEDAKRLLKEAVVLPMMFPELFTGIRQPWKGVLLFGPPGTGKTMLAKAVASQAQTTFFNVSAATLTSKMHGESEKMVRTLFSMARHYAPSTVFFDEIDSLMCSRGGHQEHDATRRLKSEMLSQMDGIASHVNPNGLVMVLATTNTPWDLDDALRRRLEKRIYIPLPDVHARQELFKLYLKTVTCSGVVIEDLARRSEGYSGADIYLLCREASMAPMRRVVAAHSPTEMARLKQEGNLQLTVTGEDFTAALANTKPSVSQGDLKRYEDWEKDFASV
eukprot:CAMPEP_0114562350 /NCGR_PEP_ID=MMETSP0114-20121206/12482_1 /TAXON_ID=31324 /ORGANISM="Goniomonas sp, Strain m" /LENGTH=698 /DNA_ID=CAMNT_0001748029 /DNA_START=83 /DNA_END=2179 /DNA_ORIENTATION=+